MAARRCRFAAGSVLSFGPTPAFEGATTESRPHHHREYLVNILKTSSRRVLEHAVGPSCSRALAGLTHNWAAPPPLSAQFSQRYSRSELPSCCRGDRPEGARLRTVSTECARSRRLPQLLARSRNRSKIEPSATTRRKRARQPLSSLLPKCGEPRRGHRNAPSWRQFIELRARRRIGDPILAVRLLEFRSGGADLLRLRVIKQNGVEIVETDFRALNRTRTVTSTLRSSFRF